MNYTIFITVEPYLAQWLQHENDGNLPLQLQRSSVEAKFVEMHLKEQPKDSIPQLKAEDGQLPIALPWFKNVDIRTYNYLPPKACLALKDLFRNRFILQLWNEVHTFEGAHIRIDMRLAAFMEKHGIAYDDTNYNTIHKIYDRLRNSYRKRAERERKSKKS